jgi:hypothetical protein
VAYTTDNQSVERAKAQFDVAFSRLEAAQRRLQALASDPRNDGIELQTARNAYDHARLFWLSSEAALRSVAIFGTYHCPVRRVVILQGNSHVSESIALLLRLRGFRTTVMSTHHPADADGVTQQAAVVLVDVERKPQPADELALNRIRMRSAARLVAMIPPALHDHAWDAFDAVLLKPASIEAIIQVILAADHA